MAFGLDDALAAGLRIIDKIIPDPAAKAAATLEAVKLQQAGEFKDIEADLQKMQMQADINKIEAASESLFKSGWRPLIGWVSGIGLGYEYLIQPLLSWLSLNNHWQSPPSLDLGVLMTLLGGMLGLGTMRTVEKAKGVNK